MDLYGRSSIKIGMWAVSDIELCRGGLIVKKTQPLFSVSLSIYIFLYLLVCVPV